MHYSRLPNGGQVEDKQRQHHQDGQRDEHVAGYDEVLV